MDYYDLKLYKPISIEKFSELFQQNLCIRRGAISVFEDSMGKPGDAIYSLIDLKIINDPSQINFEFRGGEKITIYNIKNLYVNEKIIGIDCFEKLEWIGLNFHRVYESIDNKLTTKSLNGNHHFNINEKGIPFLFYAW